MHSLIVAGLAESPVLPGFLPRLFAALATASFLLYLFPLGVKAVIRFPLLFNAWHTFGFVAWCDGTGAGGTFPVLDAYMPVSPVIYYLCVHTGLAEPCTDSVVLHWLFAPDASLI